LCNRRAAIDTELLHAATEVKDKKKRGPAALFQNPKTKNRRLVSLPYDGGASSRCHNQIAFLALIENCEFRSQPDSWQKLKSYQRKEKL
jgi:hypothetical protein